MTAEDVQKLINVAVKLERQRIARIIKKVANDPPTRWENYPHTVPDPIYALELIAEALAEE
jgi:hypothetical protein